ncbi:MAG: hypothetical protein ACJAVA_000201 [Flavobacteriaceae bacterium]|jgi:hypothetical protein
MVKKTNNMNSSFIDKVLHREFQLHKYQLSNSFIYNEESDFFSMTASGYAQEIEVKVSRSDFKADFKKYKHASFKQLISGQKYVVKKGYITWKVKEPIMINFVGEDGKGVYVEDKYGRKRPKTVPSGKFREYTSMGKPNKSFESQAISTGIRIFKPILPNKFWFAVPENLIPLDEIPDYAGLYYITEGGKLKIIKRAPFIHKEKHNINKVLLDKFYYLSLKLKSR